MIIRNINGAVITHSDERTLRRAAEQCVAQKLDLSGADFRGEKLVKASLDGARAKGACFWGADLTGSDLGIADLRGADMRRASLKECCLAESDLSGADLRGAYFSNTLLDGAILDGARISCPSVWSCDLQTVSSMCGLVYSHKGEVDIVLNRPPLVLRGLPQRLVLLPGFCLWGSRIYTADDMPADLRRAMKSANAAMTNMLRRPMRDAKRPIPKISGAEASF